MSSRPVLSRYVSALIDSPVASCRSSAAGDSVAVGAVGLSGVRANAPGAEVRNRPGDAVLEVLIEELPLCEIDRGVDLLAGPAPRDPGRNPVGDHLAPDVDAHERIVVLGHGDAHPEKEAGALDEPPAPFPAEVAVVVAREMDGVVGHHRL